MKIILKYIVIIFSFLLLNNLKAQNKANNFSLRGKINIDTGKILFTTVADSNFYPKSMRHLKVKIVKGEFFIQGNIPHPLAFELLTEDRNYLSEMFVLDTGHQVMEIDVKLIKKALHINNQIMLHETPIYQKEFESVYQNRKILDIKWDSLNVLYKRKIPLEIQKTLDAELRKCYRENDTTLLAYISRNPNSYYAFWRLLRLTQFGYVEIFRDMNAKFSSEIKNNYSGVIFTKYLSDFNLITLSDKIKKFPLERIDKKKIDSIAYKEHKYTLIDFWYSNCSPCIAQFKYLTSIYEEYKAKGFEIIGISTDKINRKTNWIKIIETQNLKWPQYLDLGGIEASKLYISSFPSNIMIDTQGKVLAVNMSPSEIDNFLKMNIK